VTTDTFTDTACEYEQHYDWEYGNQWDPPDPARERNALPIVDRPPPMGQRRPKKQLNIIG
jgi:hypothetical protein